MRAITSREAILKKLKKENILTDGHIFYLTDFHKTKVGSVLVNKLFQERIIEETNGLKHWFEREFKLRERVGQHNDVDIFYDHKRKQYFFRVKKGVYDMDEYSLCVKKLDYLKGLGEKLK